jgi:hypothetical protein
MATSQDQRELMSLDRIQPGGHHALHKLSRLLNRKALTENVLPPRTKTLIITLLNELPTSANAVAVASGVVAITMFVAPLHCFLVIVHSDSYGQEYPNQHAYDQAHNSNFHSPILASI